MVLVRVPFRLSFAVCGKGGIACGFLASLQVYSATDLWFVPAYLALYLLSPVLNRGLEALSGRQLHLFLAGLLFLNVYLGWLADGKINLTGYNVMQMILMYSAGFYIRFNRRRFRLPSVFWLCGYAVATALIFLSAFYSEKAFAYNSPFVLFSSVCLFLAFARMSPFCSVAVNRVASSAFMVYLLHKSPFVWLKLKNTLLGFDAAYSGFAFVGACVLLFAGVFIVSILVDKVRVLAFRPLFAWLDSRFPKV